MLITQKHGWSLIELMIVLAIITTLTALSLPQWDYSPRLSAQQQLHRLADGIQLAKSEAIFLGQPVQICGLAPDAFNQCAEQWQAGFLVSTDSEVLYKHTWQLKGTLTWKGFGNRRALLIDERGMMRYQNGSFTYCPLDLDKTKAQQLIVNSAGRTRLAKDSDQDGTRESSNGQAITC